MRRKLTLTAIALVLVADAVAGAIFRPVALLTYHNNAYPGSPASHGYVLSLGDNRPDSGHAWAIAWDSVSGLYTIHCPTDC